MESAVDSVSTGSDRSGSRSPPRRSPLAPLLPLSPPPAPQLMPPRLPHLPPPGLGLLGSLQMMHHASPLELMAAAHHHGPPRSYNSPPPISSSDPAANECKLVDYRGQKVAAFIIQGETMLCLPQAFELFLKHLVGGLHTVYTKLKRLDIVPLVCNVEQVRILRGLGAIQPGVNRCKLLSCKDFDVLYRDCTTASSRPGRPPKRASLGLSLAAAHLPAGHPFKKHRLENGEYSPYENGHLGADISRLEKSPLLANGYNAPPTHLGHMGFMHAPHGLLSPGMPPHALPRPDGSIIKGQPNMPNMEALARSGIWENCRAAYEDIVKHLERMRDERGDIDRAMALDNKTREGSQNGISSYYRSPLLPVMTDNHPRLLKVRHSSGTGSSNGHSPVLNLSKSGVGGGTGGTASVGGGGPGGVSPSRSEGSAASVADARDLDELERDNLSDNDNASEVDDHDDKDDHDDLSDGEHDMGGGTPSPSHALNYSSLGVSVGGGGVAGSGAGATPNDAVACSTETLLRNIQGLLKVAADNARQQERQISYEKAELKMDVLREREVKDTLERQLVDEQKMRVIYQKRLKKERRARQRAQEQLEAEMKRRTKIEEALKASGAPAEVLRIVTGEILDTISSSESSNQRETGSCGEGQQAAQPGGGNGVSVGGGGGGARPGSPPSCAAPREGAPPPAVPVHADKQWNYPATTLDLMTTGAAFWQNYSESLAQEIELERKSRAQAMERDVKSPLGDRAGYYKSSVLFSSAT